jgi:hypothetical protein
MSHAIHCSLFGQFVTLIANSFSCQLYLFYVIGVSTYDLTSSYWGVCYDFSTFHHEFKLEIEKKWKNEDDIVL